MTRTGSRGSLRDHLGISNKFSIPLIDDMIGKWEVLVENEEIYDVALNLTDINKFQNGQNLYFFIQLVICKEEPKKTKTGTLSLFFSFFLFVSRSLKAVVFLLSTCCL